MNFPDSERIAFDPAFMEGKPCIRGLRVTVGMVPGLVTSGASRNEILGLRPYLDADDITAAPGYATSSR